ncbi:MAG: RnfABCDGE type electron transport complex subunit G [Candidatus Omnitrophota bacterium]
MTRFVIVLTLVCVVAALVLGLTYNVTKPLIAAQEEKTKKEALARVLPGANDYRQKMLDEKEYYEGYKGGEFIGYAIYALGKGYAGDINMLVGIDKDGRILGVEILSQQETPGLGARCVENKRGEEEPWFLKQFNGKEASGLSLKSVEVITGATITTDSIVKAIKKEAEVFLENIK